MTRQISMKISFICYRKNPKDKPWGLYFSKALFEGLIFGGAYIRRGLSTEWNSCFKIDWVSLIVGRKFTVFAFFFFVIEGNFQVKAPTKGGGGVGLYLEGRFNRGFFLHYEFGGLIFGGVYFRNFTVLFFKVMPLKWSAMQFFCDDISGKLFGGSRPLFDFVSSTTANRIHSLEFEWNILFKENCVAWEISEPKLPRDI